MEDDYLSICDGNLKVYLAREESFDPEIAIMLLKCHLICELIDNDPRIRDIIGFHCASVSIDALDPSYPKAELQERIRQIRQYLHLGPQQLGAVL